MRRDKSRLVRTTLRNINSIFAKNEIAFFAAMKIAFCQQSKNQNSKEYFYLNNPIKIQNMRNRKRNRMKGYDYSRDNLYFVTICVDKMKCCLGEVVDSNMDDLNLDYDLNDDAVGTSRDLSVRNADCNSNIKFQKIMQLNAYGKIVDAQLDWLKDRYQYIEIHAKIVMPNHVHAVLEIDRSLVADKSVKIKSLSELIGAFKTTSSKLIRRAEFSEFKWKRSFHDSIIKKDSAYKNIVNYIEKNPSKWENDVFNKK